MEKKETATATATSTATTDIPNFKLKKVGDDRDKRRGGVPFWPQFARPGAGALAKGGSGAGKAAIAAFLRSGVGILSSVGVVGALGMGYGRMVAPDYAAYQDSQKSKITVGADRNQYSGDLSKVPGSKPVQDSLGMVSGSIGGKTAEQLAAEKAAADAAAKTAEAPPTEDAPVPQVPDAATADAAAAASPAAPEPPKAGIGNRPGALSSVSGGGLSGGAGMSSGIGGNFGRGITKPAADKLSGLRGSNAPGRGAATPVRSRAGRGKLGIAHGQLNRAARLSNSARRGSDDSRSQLASNAFENNPGGAQTLGGAGSGIGGQGEGDPDTGSTSNQPGGGGGRPIGQGDPLPELKCGSGTVKQGNTCVSDGKSKDPTDGIIMIVKILTVLLMLLLIIQAITKKSMSDLWSAGGLSAFLAGAIIGISIILVGLGVALMAMGRPLLGATVLLSGGLGLAWAYFGWEAAPFANALYWIAAGSFIVGGVSLVGKGLDKGKDEWN